MVKYGFWMSATLNDDIVEFDTFKCMMPKVPAAMMLQIAYFSLLFWNLWRVRRHPSQILGAA
jgi:hypothetical protein